jgi:ABC-type multidrug transport system permease subunit
MTKENIVRAVAGSMVLISVILTVFVSIYWIILAAFAGLNLLQSSFTRFCPLKCVLKDKNES